MASYSDLVDVSFQDATSHQSIDGRDVLGIYMPYHWGPVNQLRVFNRTQFYEAYPESLPIGKVLNDANKESYIAYAQVKKFFENGGAFVEVYRPQLGNKYYGKTQGDFVVALKYPGVIPASLLPLGSSEVKLAVSETEVKLVATVASNEVTVESWNGQFTDVTKTEDGRFTHFSKVLESSQFLMCMPESDVEFDEVTEVLPTDLDTTSIDENSEEIIKVFSNMEMSEHTLIISPVSSNELDNAIAQVSANTKTSNAVIGLPITTEFSEQEIKAAFTSHKDKFTMLVAGREFVTIFGTRVLLNCTGGYCGALSTVATNVRVNQIASAKTYGTYIGVLDKSLVFSEVLSLHESGITSVYNSKTGPQLFGVRNALYSTSPSSYFSRSNVTRVTASILKNVFPIAFEYIHTDAAVNPITRATFESRVNSVINDNIAQQNLQADSFADASAAINTDYLTKGGRELNAILNLHFIGLVEKIKIKVVATDSSVTAEII